MTGSIWRFAVAWIGVGASLSLADDAKSIRFPAEITRFDLATRDDLLYAHWLAPLVQDDDASAWKWPREFVNQVGKWSAAYVDGPRILQATLQGCPIEGQEALGPLDQLVMECADRLGVGKPRIVVRSNPFPRSYVVMVGEIPHLVLTSSLLELFENQPDQFRFIVGRELGHLKCDHLRLRRVSFGLLSLLRGLDLAAVPEKAHGLMPTYAVGRLLTWTRESEISADRAGLICCGNPDLAYDALLTLLHGLKADSAWRDPRHPTFDADRILHEFRAWEKEPLIVALQYLHEQSVEMPYVAERLAALKQFVAAGQYQALLDRPAKGGRQLMVTLEGIDLLGLAPTGAKVSPYFKCYDGDQLLITSATAPRGHVAYFKEFRTAIKIPLGTPLFFEVWDDGYASDTLLGGFVLYPNLPPEKANALGHTMEQVVSSPILWDWKERSTRTDVGVARARLQLIPVK